VVETRRYDPGRPLIFIHVPKTGGNSLKQVFLRWFPGLLLHYYDERASRPPERRSLGPGDVVYGHFNRLRGFGVQDYYPQVDQFITVLREPFEMAVSNYYFLKRTSRDWKRPPDVGVLEDIVSRPLNMLNHFPLTVTEANYREVVDSFLYVGVTEAMDRSLQDMARVLGRELIAPGHTNRSERDRDVRDLRRAFEDNHALEYRVYRRARSRLGLGHDDGGAP
jgi:hypothetical protein